MKTGTKVLISIACCFLYGLISAILSSTGVKIGGVVALLIFLGCMGIAYFFTHPISIEDIELDDKNRKD